MFIFESPIKFDFMIPYAVHSPKNFSLHLSKIKEKFIATCILKYMENALPYHMYQRHLKFYEPLILAEGRANCSFQGVILSKDWL